MPDKSHSLRNGLFCVVVFAACFCIAWPAAEMGFVDDWSYIKSAQVFAHTGRLVYNGWATAMLGWQVAWGALSIRIFGFSFMTVKLSTLSIAIFTILLFHAVQLRFGITPRNAVIGTLTLCLSPLFLPLAASFMTDIPGLFIIVLCLYCCRRAVQGRSNATTIAWLGLAAASNVVGGTARQIAWLGVLVMVPSTGWLLRKRPGVFPAAILLMIGGAAGVLGCVRWFARQPYSIPETLFRAEGEQYSVHYLTGIVKIFSLVLVLLLMVLPVLIAWLPQIRKVGARTALTIVCILLTWTYFQWMAKWYLPWISNVILFQFVTARDADVSPPDNFLLPVPICLLVSLLLTAAALVFLATVWRRLSARKFRPAPAYGREMFWLFAPFALSYFALMIPRAAGTGDVFDRYMLCLMPIAILCLIRLHQEWIAPGLPASSVLTLVVFAVLTIAGTRDWFAWQRARLAAIDEVRASGVPRNEIQGGFEYDGWTQIEEGGYINEKRIEVPPASYHPNMETLQVAKECGLAFASATPVIHPKYTVAFSPKPCLAHSRFPPVEYRAWLPPFRKAIYVQKILSPQQSHRPKTP